MAPSKPAVPVIPLPPGLHRSLSSFEPMTPTASPMEDPFESLSTRLRLATISAHQAAMLPDVVAQLVGGRLPQALHLRYLMMLHAIYSSLERALSEHSTDPLLCNVYNPALLARAPSLDGDCSHYTGERDWKGTVGANALKMEDPKALRDYVGRLDALGTEEGGANKLLAHAYVRYLGDLSGGQVIAKTIRKAYALPSTGEGSAFYEFYLPPPSLSTPASDDRSTVPTSSSTIPQRAGPTETKAIKTWLKAGIDEAGRRMTEDERLEVLEEARRAFQLNIDIFSSFEGMVTKSEVEVGKKEQREVPTGVQETGLGTYVGVGVLLLLVLYLLVRENEVLLA